MPSLSFEWHGPPSPISPYTTHVYRVCVCRRQRHHKKFLDDDDFLDETGRKSRILSPLCVCVDGEDSRINITRVPYSRRYSFSGTRHSYRRMITTNFRTWWFSSFSFLKEKIHVHGKWNYLGFKFIRTNEPFLTIDKYSILCPSKQCRVRRCGWNLKLPTRSSLMPSSTPGVNHWPGHKKKKRKDFYE
jgi:hypothetical protein